MVPVDSVVLRAHVALAVATARKLGLPKDVLQLVVDEEWRRLDSAEAAAEAGRNATTRRGPRRGGGI